MWMVSTKVESAAGNAGSRYGLSLDSYGQNRNFRPCDREGLLRAEVGKPRPMLGRVALRAALGALLATHASSFSPPCITPRVLLPRASQRRFFPAEGGPELSRKQLRLAPQLAVAAEGAKRRAGGRTSKARKESEEEQRLHEEFSQKAVLLLKEVPPYARHILISTRFCSGRNGRPPRPWAHGIRGCYQ